VEVLLPFHAAAAVAPPGSSFGTPALVRAQLLESLDDIQALDPPAHRQALLSQLRGWEAQAFKALAPVLAARPASGCVRECHGDLHLGNVAQIDGRTTVFDGIDFSDSLRWIDVMSELAFMLMDLHAHGLPALAHRLCNAYLQGSGDYAGAAVLPWYLVHRALVRAKVGLLRARQASADGPEEAAAHRYLELALRFSRPRRPALLVTHGLSGSGKTTLSQGLVEAAGAVRIRADVERKRLAGLGEHEASGSPLGGGLYGTERNATTYARLFKLAEPLLRAGWPVILDASFLRRGPRDDARCLARRLGLPFVILDFEADADTLRQRLRQRRQQGTDASEADESVLALQLQTAEPLQADEAAQVVSCRAVPGVAAAVDWAPLLGRLAAGRDADLSDSSPNG
jgi:uncharacterized protein